MRTDTLCAAQTSTRCEATLLKERRGALLYAVAIQICLVEGMREADVLACRQPHPVAVVLRDDGAVRSVHCTCESKREKQSEHGTPRTVRSVRLDRCHIQSTAIEFECAWHVPVKRLPLRVIRPERSSCEAPAVPQISLISVVFPAPLGPMTASN